MNKEQTTPNDSDNEGEVEEAFEDATAMTLKDMHMLMAQRKLNPIGRTALLLKKAKTMLLQQTQKINYLKVAYQLYIFTLSCSVLILSILAYQHQDLHLPEMLQIIDNWRAPALMDVKFTTTNKDCAQAFGRQYGELFRYDWSGTLPACDCTDYETLQKTFVSSEADNTRPFFNERLKIGSICNQRELGTGCKTVHEIPKKWFSMWSEGAYGVPFTLCAKRDSNITLEKSILRGSACSQGQKLCRNSEFCVPANSTCPISRIGFNSAAIQAAINNQSLDGGVLRINPNLNFYFVRDDRIPIALVNVSETADNQSMCADIRRQNISPSRFEYPLMQYPRSQCQEDQGFERVHTINEEQFYLANNNHYLKQLLPFYQISQKYNFSMFTKTYIDWSASCRGEMLARIIEVGESLDIIYLALRSLLVITIIYFILVGLILPSFGLMSAMNQQITFMESRKRKQYSVIFFYEIFFKTVLEGAEMGVIIYSFYVVYLKQQIVDQVLEMSCTENGLVQTVLREVSGDIYDFIWSQNLAILVIFAFVLVFDCYLLVDAYRKNQIQPLTELVDWLKSCFNSLTGRDRSQVHPLAVFRRQAIVLQRRGGQIQ